jgi:hypothetical protein
LALKITEIGKDLPQLNRELTRIDTHESQIASLKSQFGIVTKHLDEIKNRREVVSTNNLTFTWTGGTLKLSWAAGFLRDNALKYYTALAGTSLALTASTYYWIGWNPKQAQMSFQTSLDKLTNLGNILVVCRVFTGTAGQSGVAGGGGSEPGGDGVSGATYKNF